MQYSFHQVDCCNMCQSSLQHSRVLGVRVNSQTGFFPHRKVGLTVSVLRCGECGLVFANPQPRPTSLDQHYKVPPSDYWSESELAFTSGFFQKEIGIAKNLLKFRPGMVALDVGAGVGKGMSALRDAEFQVCGIEPSATFRDYALAQFGFDHDLLLQSSFEDAMFDESSIDFISFGAVLEHLYDPYSALEKALSWLRPGGIIQAEVPSSDWLISRLLNLYYRLIGTTYVTNLSPMHSPYHIYEFTLESFKRFAARANCELALSEYYVCHPYWIPDVLKPLVSRIMRHTSTGMQLCIWLRRP